ncbi:MAG: bifunctional nuclease family protein [Bacteroidota bacterium]|nr:bifunctional nuclease family protein [Bacteroidota bacterium]
MQKIQLDVLGMSVSQSQSGAYALILGERGGKRRLPIIIGAFEAQSIAIVIEKIKPPRPLTHDLFKAFAETFHIGLSEVIINKFSEGVFYAILVCSDGSHNFQIDSRTSDAIALALRFNCPIYTFESIMTAAGILMEEENEPSGEENPVEEEDSEQEDLSLQEYSMEELREILQAAVENEEYEKASQIRDEIKRRTK